MQESELRDLYFVAYRILTAEIAAREHVFRHKPAYQKQKVDEMQRALDVLTRFKDELKLHVEVEAEQMRLLRDTPTGDY